jgi:hypothetical protein
MSKKTENKKEKQLTKPEIGFTNENISIQTIRENQEAIKDINHRYKTWVDFTTIISDYYAKIPFRHGGYDYHNPIGLLNHECYLTIESSIILATNGYYRPAISLLRCWYETSLYGIYYNDHKVEFLQSMYEDEPEFWFMLNMSNFIKYLFKLPSFRLFDMELKKKREKNELKKFRSFQNSMNEVYMELSAYIHGRGKVRIEILSINPEEKTRNYNKTNFDCWNSLFCIVSSITTTSFILYNPKLLNKYPSKRKQILGILNKDFIDILTKNFGVKY